MRVVLVTLGGETTVGDTVLLHFVPPGGGRSTTGHVVRNVEDRTPVDGGFLVKHRIETIDEVALELANAVSNPGSWGGEFEIKANANVLTIICSNAVQNGIFVPEILGAGTETITIRDL